MVINVAGINPRFWNMAQVPLDIAQGGIKLYKGGYPRLMRIRQRSLTALFVEPPWILSPPSKTHDSLTNPIETR